MKKFILLVLIAFAAFLVYNRQRLFLRDPLGSVLRDGVKEEGAMAFINYSNDVLLENDRAPMYVTMVQAGQVGTPTTLKCIHYVACLADEDTATKLPPEPGVALVSMSSRMVEYRDAHGRDVKVTLR